MARSNVSPKPTDMAMSKLRENVVDIFKASQTEQAAKVQSSVQTAFSDFDRAPDSAFIRLPIMVRLYGVSKATIWRGCRSGTIPAPVKLTERCTAWNVGLVRAALAAKAVQS